MKFFNTNPPPDYPRPPASRLMVSFHRTPACAQGSVEIANHPRGPICDDRSGSGVLRAVNGMPVGHIDYQEGIVSVLPEPVLEAIEKWHMPNSAHKLNADQTVAVATDVYFNPDMSAAPRGVKLQLIGEGGVAVYANYHGDPFWKEWAPVPKRRKP